MFPRKQKLHRKSACEHLESITLLSHVFIAGKTWNHKQNLTFSMFLGYISWSSPGAKTLLLVLHINAELPHSVPELQGNLEVAMAAPPMITGFKRPFPIDSLQPINIKQTDPVWCDWVFFYYYILQSNMLMPMSHLRPHFRHDAVRILLSNNQPERRAETLSQGS